MPLALFDSHCHLDDEQYDTDRDAVFQRATRDGISDIVLPAVTRSTWQKNLDTALMYPRTHAALGLHPLYMDEHADTDLMELEQHLQLRSIVAIGECGLDGSAEARPRAEQEHCLEAQLQLAHRVDLPVILHARAAVEAVYLALRRSRVHQGVVHSFNGSEQQAHRIIDQGLYLGFGGAITYPRASRLRQLVSRLPLDCLVLETDAPFQTGCRNSGKRNEPAWLVEVLETVSALRDEPAEEIAAATHANACRLFRLNASDGPDHDGPESDATVSLH